MDIKQAKIALDKLIRTNTGYEFNPVLVAEILYRDRVFNDIDLKKSETYRTKSRRWADIVLVNLLGKTLAQTKSQESLFDQTGIDPHNMFVLGLENRQKKGVIEAYIYSKFYQRHHHLQSKLLSKQNFDRSTFQLAEFTDLFWYEPRLRGYVDKIYQITLYSLFSVLVEELDIIIEVGINSSKAELLTEFEEFTNLIIDQTSTISNIIEFNEHDDSEMLDHHGHNLAMWVNFRSSIQVKYITLEKSMIQGMVEPIKYDKLVIICKDAEKSIISHLFSQMGWSSKLNRIISDGDLREWYEKAQRGISGNIIGEKLMKILSDEIVVEFPPLEVNEFNSLYVNRGYDKLTDDLWKIKRI